MRASIVGAELERIRQRDGVLRASVVVTEARPEESPIHEKFTWDDEKAADEYRLIEARSLIRTVVVVENNREMPAYVHVSGGAGEGYYQSISVLVQPAHRDEFASALTALRGRLNAAGDAVDALESAAAAYPERHDQLRQITESVRGVQELVNAVA